jgi:hypothetical protein
MNTPLALPDYSVLSEWTPKVGDIVENFGAIARVLDIDPERGIQLREIGQPASAGTWRANPLKCRPVR